MNYKIADIWFTKSFPTLWTLHSRRFFFACIPMCAWVFVCSHGCGYMCVNQRLTLDFFLIAPPIVCQGQGLSLHLELSVSVLAIQLAAGILCPCVLGTGLQVGCHTYCHLCRSWDLNFSSKACTAVALLTWNLWFWSTPDYFFLVPMILASQLRKTGPDLRPLTFSLGL